MTKKITPPDPIALRTRLGMSQTVFWERLGVKQSSGSRYESGRRMPVPIQKLMVLAYGTESQRRKTLEALTQHI